MTKVRWYSSEKYSVPEFVNTLYQNMADSPFTGLKIRDLRQLERAMQTRIELLLAFKIEDHENNAVFLTLVAEGITMRYKTDHLQGEIQHCELLLERIRMEILSR